MALKADIMLNKYNWSGDDKIRATGFCRNGKIFLEGKQLADYFDGATHDFKTFCSFCWNCNGQFSVVVINSNEIWLHCGHTWSYPLFYAIQDKNLLITDEPEESLGPIKSNFCSKTVEDYFLTFGVTPGNNTLFDEIRLIRPGETVQINLLSGLVSCHTFEMPAETEKEITQGDLAAKIRESFAKYTVYLKEKEVFLPLTAGYDSRLLACLLKEAGLRNVTCVTWGRKGIDDAETAWIISEILRYRHIFIPYEQKMIEGFALIPEFEAFAKFAGHCTSMPFLQDYFAIKHLKKKGQIPENAVFLPGHPGDFLRGSHLYEGLYNETPSDTARSILQQFGTSLPLNYKNRKAVLQTITTCVFDANKNAKMNFDRWDFQERQCKLLGNSSQVYTWFGVPYIMPLFDREIFRFMLALPFRQRLFASLYNSTLENEFFIPNKVNIAQKEPEKGFVQPSWIKKWIIRNASYSLKEKYYPVDDPVYYREITQELMASMPDIPFRKPEKPHFYNAYLVQWYLHWLKTRS